MKTAIVLCSGGIDSVTTAYYVKKKLGYGRIILMFCNYGQRTLKQERRASKYCAKKLKVSFVEVKLDFLSMVSTSIINSKKDAKKVKRKDLKDTRKESENYYVPCRNTIFLTHALVLAESIFLRNNQISDIFVGFKNEGDEPYPDTTEAYVKKINELSGFCMKKFCIKAPLIKKDKEDIIKLGVKLGIDYKNTFTCYVGARRKHCGYCLSCRLRQEGFYFSGIRDPTDYKIKMKDFRENKKGEKVDAS